MQPAHEPAGAFPPGRRWLIRLHPHKRKVLYTERQATTSSLTPRRCARAVAPLACTVLRVELQEATLRGLVVHVAWDTTPRFMDVRGALTDQFRAVTEEPDDWAWSS